MKACSFDIKEIVGLSQQAPGNYHQFIKVPSMRTGVYTLEAGAFDDQTPHEEDEIYYVLSGEAKLEIDEGKEILEAFRGSVLFVPRQTKHRFIQILSPLQLLVVFSATHSSRLENISGIE